MDKQVRQAVKLTKADNDLMKYHAIRSGETIQDQLVKLLKPHFSKLRAKYPEFNPEGK